MRLERVVGDSQVDEGLNRTAQSLDCVDQVASQVQFSEARRQVLNALNFVISQVQDLQVLELQQLLIHRLNVIFLGEERLKKFEQILLGADVLVQPYFFYYLAQLEGFLRPELCQKYQP